MIWPFRPTDRRILDLRRKLRGMIAVATQLREEKARLVDANKTLRRLVDIQTSARDAALADRIELREQLDRANAYVTELEEALRQRDEDHAQVSGQLQDAQERLALVDRDEDMRDEIRAKRLSDGLGDD